MNVDFRKAPEAAKVTVLQSPALYVNKMLAVIVYAVLTLQSHDS